MKKILLIFFLGILLVGIVNAGYCCEKTIGPNPALCMNVESDEMCDVSARDITGKNYLKAQTSCELTSFCRIGTCINLETGECLPSTEPACSGEGGIWNEKTKNEIPQCKLGCCFIGNSATFMTQATCSVTSKNTGLKTEFDPTITDAITCAESANPTEEGACTYVENYVKTCKFTSRENCQEMEKDSSYSEVNFNSNLLCTAESLETNCIPTRNTKCYGGKVYFIDSEGNRANIYDSSKISDKNYWTYPAGIMGVEVCEVGSDGNKDSANCGNCDYSLGSFCSDKGNTPSGLIGDYYCKNLDCVDYRGIYSGGVEKDSNENLIADATHYPRHGESWCAWDGIPSSPGSSSYVLSCVNGEVGLPKSCDPIREKVCNEVKKEDSEGKVYYEANCKANQWRSCTAQTNKTDCENIELRDCEWIEYRRYYFNATEMLLKPDRRDCDKNSECLSNLCVSGKCVTGACVPKYGSGFVREGNPNLITSDSCLQANSQCVVTTERNIFGSVTDEENGYCKEDEFVLNMMKICNSLGDCGNENNVIGKPGTVRDVIEIIEEEGGQKIAVPWDW
ncbi:MAG: hypothetical protein WC979_10180 [Candidatus Pacearchaeota archaeon]|jgi:hypothetical protein